MKKYGDVWVGEPQLGRTTGVVTAGTIAGLQPGESITTYVRDAETGNRAVHSIIFRPREDRAQ